MIFPLLSVFVAMKYLHHDEVLMDPPPPFPRWLWTEGGSQMELESALGIGGFGYPAMAAINARKMKYALLKGSFSDTGIHEFLR